MQHDAPNYELKIVPGEGPNYKIVWPEGRRTKRVSTGTPSLAEASIFYANWLNAERLAAEAPKGTLLTIDRLWAVYWEKQVSRTPSYKNGKSDWEKRLQPHFGHLTVPEVSQSVIDKYEAMRTNQGVKTSSVRKELIRLLSCLNFCSAPRHGQKMFDPALKEKLTLPKKGKRREKWLTKEQIGALYDAARRLRTGNGRMTRVERFLYLAINTGSRETALYDLTWDRVDLHPDRMVINLNPEGREQTKKYRAENVPISPDLAAILRIAKAERINNLVLDNKALIWTSLQLVIGEAGLAPAGWTAPKKGQRPRKTGISAHTFRHTAATIMASSGVDPFDIAHILGCSVEMVLKVYAKWFVSDRARAAVGKMSVGFRVIEQERNAG
jgi:integrase